MQKAMNYIGFYFSAAIGTVLALSMMKANGDIGLAWWIIMTPLWFPFAFALVAVVAVAFVLLVWAGCSIRQLKEDEDLYE